MYVQFFFLNSVCSGALNSPEFIVSLTVDRNSQQVANVLIIYFGSVKSSSSRVNGSRWLFSLRGCKKFTALWKVETCFVIGKGRHGLNPGAGRGGRSHGLSQMN